MIKKNSILAILFLSVILVWIYIPTEADKELKKAMKIKNENPHVNVFDGFAEPRIPEKSNTLLGVDENQNGIRDDVEIWINRTWNTYNERMAVRQYAGDLQYNLQAAEKNDREFISHAASVEFTTMACLDFIIGPDDNNVLLRRIQAIVYNSKKRRNIMENFNNYSYGYNSVVPDMRLGEEYKACRFKIENESDLKSKYSKRRKY